MKRIVLVFSTVLFLIVFSVNTAFSQTTAIVIKPTAKLYKKPDAKSKAVQTIKRGQKLKLRSTDSNRSWYQVSVISEKEPLSSQAAYNAYVKSFITYWISGNDIKIQNDLPDSDTSETNSTKSETKNDWIEYASSKESIYYYNPKRTTYRGSFVQVWTEERDENDDELLSKILYEINCQSSKIRSLAGIEYHPFFNEYPDGVKVKTQKTPTTSSWDTPNSRFSIIFPDSTGEALYKTVCNK